MDTSFEQQIEEQIKSKNTLVSKNGKQDRKSMHTLQDDLTLTREDELKLSPFGPDIHKTTNDKKAFSFSKANRFTSKSIFESNSN